MHAHWPIAVMRLRSRHTKMPANGKSDSIRKILTLKLHVLLSDSALMFPFKYHRFVEGKFQVKHLLFNEEN